VCIHPHRRLISTPFDTACVAILAAQDTSHTALCNRRIECMQPDSMTAPTCLSPSLVLSVTEAPTCTRCWKYCVYALLDLNVAAVLGKGEGAMCAVTATRQHVRCQCKSLVDRWMHA
jgi:hypothetical protein